MKERTILVVDDEPDIVLTVRLVLEVEGFRVLAVGSGEDALEVLEREIPDVILLDLRLPGIDGFAVLDRLPEETPPVIVLSAHASGNTVKRAMAMGCRDFITKPFSPEYLVSRIEATLEGTA
ncbi:MAG: response regulator [Actinomycetota bacterium]